ncbi:MAG: KTSC domain-containing protein [Alphaproteobacteria bacterium]|nr:KTSC domain-containing protein [Alphaproteobacteria bacterium]MBP7759720.1 KTSC domain-containing protein [Alphaproteobacteria bacterium]MBP7904497.1 KTSC domain-containing protein [Alphaproteobacteria bacterium]
MRMLFLLSAIIFLQARPAIAQQDNPSCVYVKYRGWVDKSFFVCSLITDSSFIYEVCYDEKNQYMLIQLKQTFYHYCSINENAVSSLLTASSKGRYYNSYIKGKYDCRLNPIPEYNKTCK